MDFLSIFALVLGLAASIAVPLTAWYRTLPFSRLNYAGFALGTGVAGALLLSIDKQEGSAVFFILSFLLMGTALGSVLALFFYREITP
jgi:hypothetical protein